MKVHLASVLDGNIDAYDQVVRDYQHEIWPIASALLLKREPTEKFVADVFTRAFHQLDQYDPRYDFGAFIKTLARQMVREKIAAAPSDAPLAAYRDHIAKVFADDATAVRYQRRLNEKLDECFQQVPENIRTIFALRYEHGEDLRSISNQVHRPVASVRQLLNRSRLALTQCVAKSAGRR